MKPDRRSGAHGVLVEGTQATRPVGDQPHLRAMAMWFADATGFYFHTGSQKRLFKQLRDNPKVELGFYNPGDGAMQMVRITGKIEQVNDATLEKKLFEDRPRLSLTDSETPAMRPHYRGGIPQDP